MKKRLFILLFLPLFLLSGCAARLTSTADASLFPEPEAVPTPSLGIPKLITDEHIPYMSAYAGDNFMPDALMRRGEVCQILYSLMENPVEGQCSFSDVFPTSAYYESVACLAAWGIVSDSTGPFRPNELISWAQLLTMLSRFYPAPQADQAPHVGSFQSRRTELLSDRIMPELASYAGIEDHWAYEAIENAVARGWLTSGGSFIPDMAVTRAEFCRLMNTVLGRSCDDASVLLSGDFTRFPDVPISHHDFGNIMEACYAHDYEIVDGMECWSGVTLEPGYYRVDGALFYVTDEGTIARNIYVGHLYFGTNGRYTCGDAYVDELIENLLSSCTTYSMSASQALRAVFNYIYQNYSYVPSARAHKPTSMWYGITDFETPWAESLLTRGGGNCIALASTFCLAARALGYQASAVYGYYRTGQYDHCWVVIPSNGVHYLYDPQQARHNDDYSPSTFYRFRDGYPFPYYYESYYPDL